MSVRGSTGMTQRDLEASRLGDGRVMVVDFAASGPPAQTKYFEQWGQDPLLDGWHDDGDLQLVGDFMGAGHDQVLFINRQDAGDGRIIILDFSAGPPPARAVYFERWGQHPLFDGWHDDGDLQLVGDFTGVGHDQVLFLNRQDAGDGRVMIVDFAAGGPPPQVKYLEQWGQDSFLDGWHDDGDVQLVGDFMGAGHDQVLFINRQDAGDGRVMIVDFAAGGPPGQANYFEQWGHNPLLNGWHDDGDLQLVGDFTGVGHDQVLFINRQDAGDGRVMVVDFAAGGPPAQTKYFEQWGQHPLLNGWHDDGDLQLVGDFMGVGHDQVCFINRVDAGDGRVMVVDFAMGGPPAQARYFEAWGQDALLNGWLDDNDLQLVGNFTTVGHDQVLLVNRTRGGTTFTRRDAWALAPSAPFDPVTLAFAKAVQVMQARPDSDPTSWTYQAGIHGAHTAPPAGATWNDCQHQGWFFLPWHRMYLYFFERIVRKAVIDAGGPADFALPYWNYAEPFPNDTLPLAFRTPTLPDGTPNPLFVPSPRRNAALMSGGQVPSVATTDQAAMASEDFSLPFAPAFGGGRVGPVHFGGSIGLLEQTPHNVMHPTIGGPQSGQCAGGLMTDPNCAALDPIFWLHHANIDRLWDKWLGLGGRRGNPVQQEWLAQSFEFRDETGAAVMLSCAEVIDSAKQLGYVYDTTSDTLDAAAERDRPVSLPPRPPELAAAGDHAVMLTGAVESLTLTMPPQSLQPVGAAIQNHVSGRLFVNLDNIEAQQDPGLAYAVYIQAPDGDRQHIGSFSLFGIQQMNDPDRLHEGAPGFRQSFDATVAVRALADAGMFDAQAITIIFEPIRILSPTKQDDAAPVEPTSPVKIGRVSLFVA